MLFLTIHSRSIFFFNDTATTEIYTLSLHDALPISGRARRSGRPQRCRQIDAVPGDSRRTADGDRHQDRKSTRLNSSHANISYAVFCLKKKKEYIPCAAEVRAHSS